MNRKLTLSTKAWVAVCLVAVLLAGFAISTGQLLVAVAAFSTAGIAAFDSNHVDLRRYKTWLSYGPIGLFVVCALFWPFAIIWYFLVGVRIARGTMPMRSSYAPKQVVT
jgi:hypothetical protein